MSTEPEQARLIAERIARRVAQTTPRTTSTASRPDLSAELASMRESVSDIQEKLVQLEARISSGDFLNSTTSALSSAVGTDRPAPRTHSPWLVGVNDTIAHPSQEKFGVEEAVVAELVDFFEKEKKCSLEPGGKPCDHCAMCSSRGF